MHSINHTIGVVNVHFGRCVGTAGGDRDITAHISGAADQFLACLTVTTVLVDGELGIGVQLAGRDCDVAIDFNITKEVGIGSIVVINITIFAQRITSAVGHRDVLHIQAFAFLHDDLQVGIAVDRAIHVPEEVVAVIAVKARDIQDILATVNAIDRQNGHVRLVTHAVPHREQAKWQFGRCACVAGGKSDTQTHVSSIEVELGHHLAQQGVDCSVVQCVSLSDGIAQSFATQGVHEHVTTGSCETTFSVLHIARQSTCKVTRKVKAMHLRGARGSGGQVACLATGVEDVQIRIGLCGVGFGGDVATCQHGVTRIFTRGVDIKVSLVVLTQGESLDVTGDAHRACGHWVFQFFKIGVLLQCAGLTEDVDFCISRIAAKGIGVHGDGVDGQCLGGFHPNFSVSIGRLTCGADVQVIDQTHCVVNCCVGIRILAFGADCDVTAHFAVTKSDGAAAEGGVEF